MMKKSIFFLCFLMIGAVSFAQSQTTKTRKAPKDSKVEFPEYIDKGTIPDFSVVAFPDSSKFTNKDLKKNKPLLLMIFSPECGHCQHETRLLEENMEHFKNAQILMVTWLPYKSLDKFSKNQGTTKYSNIQLAQDPNDFFYDYYKVRRYPKMVVYNKKGQYVSDYDGSVEMEDIWKDLGGK